MAPKKRGRAAAKVDDAKIDDAQPKTKRTKAASKAASADVKDNDDSAQQTAGTVHLYVPLDDHSTFSSKLHQVFIDDDDVIYDVSLNQTHSGYNNNKFYRIQLVETKTKTKYQTWTRWGRVGEPGAYSTLGDGTLASALSHFKKKFKNKSGLKWENRLDKPFVGKYVFIERSYEPDSEEEKELSAPGAKIESDQSVQLEIKITPSKLPPSVQNLMELIFNKQYFKEVMADLEYDADKLPLGKLSKRTLEQGYTALKDLASLILNGDPAETYRIDQLSNLYYSLIPHSFGRYCPPVINGPVRLKKEVELLESLSDMRIAEEIMKQSTVQNDSGVNPLDSQYEKLGMREMTPLDETSTEFHEIHEYLTKSAGSTHYFDYRVEDIFRIERNGEFEQFDTSEFRELKEKDRRLLWHGSRATNFGGILSQGLRIAPPQAPVSGYMFGKGIYLADMSSKSSNYCVSHISGNIGLLLLCEAELGSPMLELINADYNAGDRARAENKFATLGQGLTIPLKWKDASCIHESLKGVSMPDVSTGLGPRSASLQGMQLQYNEYICYDVKQVRLRYLLRVKMR